MTLQKLKWIKQTLLVTRMTCWVYSIINIEVVYIQRSLRKPSSYFKLKQELEDTLKERLVGDMYKVVYELLRYGVIDTTHVCGYTDDATNFPWIPGVPSSKVNELSLQITATLNDFMDSVISILMPPSFLQLAEGKLAIKSEASVL